MCWVDGGLKNESRQVALGKVSGIQTPALKLSASWLRLVGCGRFFFSFLFFFAICTQRTVKVFNTSCLLKCLLSAVWAGLLRHRAIQESEPLQLLLPSSFLAFLQPERRWVAPQRGRFVAMVQTLARLSFSISTLVESECSPVVLLLQLGRTAHRLCFIWKRATLDVYCLLPISDNVCIYDVSKGEGPGRDCEAHEAREPLYLHDKFNFVNFYVFSILCWRIQISIFRSWSSFCLFVLSS